MMKSRKADADRALHREHPRLEAGRKIAAEERHRRTE